MRPAPRGLGPLLALAGIACGPIATAGPGCVPTGPAIVLPDVLDETSGVAFGRRDASVIWTHNDGDSGLWGIDASGHVVASYRLAAPLDDWEDIEAAACASGSCLYFADTGDNAERREPGSIRIVRVTEPRGSSPASGDPATLVVDVFPIRLPDGARDIEALFVLPGERIHLVTKGRQDALTVYRYPPPLRPDTVTLEEVQRLSDGPMSLLAQVTGASASADGTVVAIRTYQSLELFRVDADTLAHQRDGVVNLRTLQEIQGEGVALGPDGRVALTSEGGPLGGPPSMHILACELGGI